MTGKIQKIIDNASNSDSGLVSRLDATVRRNQNFKAEASEDVKPEGGVTVESIMVTKVPVHEDIEAEALKVLGDAIIPSKSVGEIEKKRTILMRAWIQ